jgi:hypothetical protein
MRYRIAFIEYGFEGRWQVPPVPVFHDWLVVLVPTRWVR